MAKILGVCLFAILVLGSCLKKSNPVTEDIGPTVGTAMVFSNPTASSMTVTWGAATDDKTVSADLQYKLVRSATNNVSTVGDAEANGTVALDWTANTTTTTATGLSSSTTYYFALLIRDSDSNVTLDSSTATTYCSGKIIFLATVSDANLGGVAGGDTVCNAQKPAGFGGSTFKALLSDGTTRRACTVADCRSSLIGRADWMLSTSADLCVADFSKRIGTTNSFGILYVSTANVLSSTATSTFTGFDNLWASTNINCAGWTSLLGSGVIGTANGIFNSSVSTFIAKASLACNSAATIYCVEQ